MATNYTKFKEFKLKKMFDFIILQEFKALQ